MAELKPCPFCGGIARRVIHISDGSTKVYRGVYCQNCEAQSYRVLEHGDPYKMDTIAVRLADQAWNRRYEPHQELEFDYGAED